mmetsp:Transcript_37098/g.98837  ORF Transcript_37098/g.98837 Transcript_37098/m.98837 type:complete len:103 (-) Transcript_37098:217-525(-)
MLCLSTGTSQVAADSVDTSEREFPLWGPRMASTASLVMPRGALQAPPFCSSIAMCISVGGFATPPAATVFDVGLSRQRRHQGSAVPQRNSATVSRPHSPRET